MEVEQPRSVNFLVDRKNAWNLLFASLIVNIGFGLAAPLFAALGNRLDVGNLIFIRLPSAVSIGILISSFMVARMVSASIIPASTDIYGRKKILVVALAVYGISTIGIGFGRDFWTLFLLRLLEGASVGAAFPVSEALLVDSVPSDERGAWMGKYFTTFNLGFVIGPGLGGVMYALGHGTELGGFYFKGIGLDAVSAFIIPFGVTGILGLLSSLLVGLLVRDIYQQTLQEKISNAQKNEDRIQGQKALAEALFMKSYQVPFIYRLYTISMVNGFAIGLIIPIFALYAINEFSLREEHVGFLFTIAGGLSLPINYPAGKLSDRFNRLNIALFGMFVGALAFIGIGLVTSLQLLIFFFIIRFMAIQTFIPPFRAFQADVIPPPVRGRYFGRVQALFNLGATIGPVAGGILYDTFSGTTYSLFGVVTALGGGISFVTAGFIALISVMLLFSIKRDYHPQKHLFSNVHKQFMTQEDFDAPSEFFR